HRGTIPTDLGGRRLRAEPGRGGDDRRHPPPVRDPGLLSTHARGRRAGALRRRPPGRAGRGRACRGGEGGPRLARRRGRSPGRARLTQEPSPGKGGDVARSPEGVVLVQSPVSIAARQQVPVFVGISRETAGARGICMHRIVIPPGAATAPHSHVADESAIYVLAGEVEILHGPGLRERLVAREGDFLYI